MPSRDDSGKRIPGSKQRQRKREREAPDRPARSGAKLVDSKKRTEKKSVRAVEAAPAASGKAKPVAPKLVAEIDEVELLPPAWVVKLKAPPKNTAGLITWAAQVCGQSLYETTKHPEYYPNRREWLRAISSAAAQLGVIRDKAAEQERIDKALREAEAKKKKQGLDNVRGRKAAPVPRPSG